jgi:UDPglucose 6-dehydrogenase
MKVGIAGYGFVGKALNAALSDDVDVIKVDPKLNTTMKDLKDFNPEILFVCVPTPMLNDGNQNIKIVYEVLNEIINLNIECLVVIKSTIHPGNIEALRNLYPSFVYNPEFLRENHAEQDFVNADLIVFGGDEKDTKFISNFYAQYTSCVCKDYVLTDHLTASLIKYTINSFLASKVFFFNEMHDLFKIHATNESWENFVSAISKDKRIGSSHMSVPGPDGRYGFGGACFPKDTNAILKYAKSMNCDLNLIEATIKINNKIRESYDKLTDREYEQNIKYNIEEE